MISVGYHMKRAHNELTIGPTIISFKIVVASSRLNTRIFIQLSICMPRAIIHIRVSYQHAATSKYILLPHISLLSPHQHPSTNYLN